MNKSILLSSLNGRNSYKLNPYTYCRIVKDRIRSASITSDNRIYIGDQKFRTEQEYLKLAKKNKEKEMVDTNEF